MPIWKGHSIGRLVMLIMLAISSIAGLAGGSRAQAETAYTPSVGLSQRYDSNVFFGPKEFIPAGRHAWDLVTTARAGVEVENKSRLGDSFLRAGVSGNALAYNTDLSFVSTDVLGSTDLSSWTDEVVRGLKLNISDKFLYTPEAPAFLTGGQAAQTADVFTRGIQGVRANTFRNVLSTQAAYSLSRSVGLRTDYSYSIFRRGRIIASLPDSAPVRYFDTTVHSVATGPTYDFGGGDTLFLHYNYVSGESKSVSGQGSPTDYVAHTVATEYVSRELQGWTVTIIGGATRVESVGDRTFFSGKFGLGTNVDERTPVQVSVSRQVAPSFFGTGGALISNLAQVSVGHGFTRLLRLTVNGNYAYSETTPTAVFTIKSITTSAMLEYKMTRSTVLSLSQEYQQFSYTGVPTFDRYATMLTLRTEWK